MTFAPAPAPPSFGPSTRTAVRERARVARHIRRAERAARENDAPALEPLQRLVRALLLDELVHYRRARRFPRNPDFAVPTPYFVDAAGTRCAMAHLMELGGEGAFVARVARDRNNARVRELADEPRLLAWLAAAGLTVAEAAAIQPQYEYDRDPYAATAANYCACSGASFAYPGSSSPATGVLEAVVVAARGDDYPVARVEAVHGEGQGYAVGTSLRVVTESCAPGTRVLVPVGGGYGHSVAEGGLPALPALPLATDGAYHCGVPAYPDAGLAGAVVRANDQAYFCDVPAPGLLPAMTTAQVIAAVTARDCREHLIALEPRWSTACHSVARTSLAHCDADAAAGDAAAYDASGPDAPMDADAAGPATEAHGGCDARPHSIDGGPTTLGILLVLVSTLVARRATRPRIALRRL